MANNGVGNNNNNAVGGSGGGGGGGISNSTFRRFTQLPDYTKDKKSFEDFLEKFTEGHTPTGEPIRPYWDMLVDVANRRTGLVNIRLSHLLSYQGQSELVGNVVRNTMRYRAIAAEAIDKVLVDIRAELPVRYDEDVIDVLMQQRRQLQEEAEASANNPDGGGGDPSEHVPAFPPQLMRRYDVNFIPDTVSDPKHAGRAVRDVTANDIGHLVSLSVMVTRVSDVKPLVTVATYTCDACGFEIYQEIKSRSFMPLTECQSARCKDNGTPGKLFLQTRGSKFSKFQTAKVQEIPEQVCSCVRAR